MPDRTPPQSDTAVWRILDAAANRAEEGLRVVEDYLRFALDDRHLTELAKRLRHDLAQSIARLSASGRLAARETVADVGTTIVTPTEQRREDAAAVAAANFKRLEQSLRSLEEFSKTVAPAVAAEFEALRYRCYTLERAIGITTDSLQRLVDVRLYLLIDGRGSADELADLAAKLLAAGVQAIQLRDKRLSDREMLQRARRLKEVTAVAGALMVMNDRADLALLAQADALHVGQDELSVKNARAIVGPNMLIGVSTHSIEQARQAVLDGANYIGVGPTFPSGTKQFAEFPGLGFLKQVAAEIRLPAFAIGGITEQNLPEVLATGVSHVAVSGAILSAEDSASAAAEFRRVLG